MPRSQLRRASVRTSIHLTGVVWLVAVGSACQDDPADPGTGTVQITTVSTGEGLDQDGYMVQLQGAAPTPIGINTTATFPGVIAGEVEVRLTSIRGNCTLQGPNPRLLRVVAGETFSMHYDVACVHTPLLGRIVFTSNRDGNYEVYSMNPDGSDQVRLTDTPDDRELVPASSPDGTRILFVDRVGPYDDVYTSDLYVMNADGTGRVNLTNAAGTEEDPVWSPDGSQIAFWSVRDGSADIWVMDADGRGQRNLTNSPSLSETTPVWSPEGDRILFTASTSSASHLDVINADGSGRAHFTDQPADIAFGILSPDGARIAYSAQATGYKLFTTSTDGSDPKSVTGDLGGAAVIASWSSGGDRIAFASDATGDLDVYVTGRDGTGTVNISNNAAFDMIGAQAWGP